MMRFKRWAQLAIACWTLLGLAGVSVATRGVPAQAQEVAEKYLSLMAQGKRAEMRKLTPVTLKGRFGECPFAQMPTLGRARVSGHQGGIDFKGPMSDPNLPQTGFIMLVMIDDANRTWKVSRFAWYDELPKNAGIREKSETEKDRLQEPRVKAAAAKYLRAWLKGDHKTLDRMLWDWLSYNPVNSVKAKLQSLSLDYVAGDDCELYLGFTAKAKFYYILTKTVSGRLNLVRENNQWKVRSDRFMFVF